MTKCIGVGARSETDPDSGASAVLGAALLPIAAYLAYLLSSLPLELWRAVLPLPGKLDALRQADRTA